MPEKVKILLVQLASNGDCLFTTTIAKQIKEIDHPNCELSWLIGTKFKSILDFNPHVDKIETIEIQDLQDMEKARANLDGIIENLPYKYDKIYITDHCERNKNNWYGTTRSSLFRSYKHKLKISSQPVIVLSESEIKGVNEFIEKQKLSEAKKVILFECSPQSMQSKLNFEDAVHIAEKIVVKNKDVKIILSSPHEVKNANENIIDASTLSFRQNAELVKHCDLLIGCSSGITWISFSNAAKKIPMIQFINAPAWASVYWDCKYFGIDTQSLIETTRYNKEYAIELIDNFLNQEFSVVKKKHHLPSTSGSAKFFLELYNKKLPLFGLFIGFVACLNSLFINFPFKLSIYLFIRINTPFLKPRS